jgi:MoaA/NifB/PqqE/SkfB family radical SAM enzyme
MALDQFQSIIGELGPYLFQVDLFNWGEPLLNKKLLDMIACLKKYEINVRLSTSLAVPLADEFLKGLILSGTDYIIISIDGMSPETYETYRVDGDFHLAMSNMEKMAQLKHQLKVDKPRLEWQYLVFSFNEHELPQAIRHARRIGVEFRPAAPYIDLDLHPDWLPSEDKFVREPYKASRASNEEGPKELDRMGSLPSGPMSTIPAAERFEEKLSVPDRNGAPDAGTTTDPHLTSPRRYQCDWHYLKACINADATLSPCCGLYPGEPNWGELGRNSFQNHWNDTNLKEARKTLAEGCLDSESQLICSHCPLPEIQQDGHSVLLDALLDAPEPYRRPAKSVLESFPRRERLERQSLRFAGKLLRCLPYSSRDFLRRRLRHEMHEGILRRAFDSILALAK